MGWVATLLRAVGYVLGGVAAVAAGLQAAGVWHLTGKALITLVVGAAAVTLIGQVVGLIRDLRRRGRETLAQDVRSYLFGMFINVLEGTKIPARKLGFAAYVVRRRWIWRWPTYRRGKGWRWRWPQPWRRVLMRLDRHRPPDRHDTSRTVWTVGKGVIGLCVKRGQLTYADVGKTWGPWKDCTSDEWEAAPEDVRMGFTYSEFQRRKGRTGGVVWAVPLIRDKGGKTKVIGCVAVDGPTGTLDQFERPAAQTVRHMVDASSSIANRLLQ